MRDVAPLVWSVADGGSPAGTLVIDEVLGKHEMIVYAVALDTQGAIKAIEILEYREAYGGQIRTEAWRKQFVGKRHGAALKLDVDVMNIGGATLSCKHVLDGVRRVLALHQIALKDA